MVVEKDNGMGADAFFAPFKAKVFGGGGFDRYKAGVYAKDVSNGLSHLGDIGADFGFLGHDYAVDIADGEVLLLEEFVAVGQEQFAVDAFVAWVGVGEVFAYVAQCSGTQHGIAYGVEQNVGVGVA